MFSTPGPLARELGAPADPSEPFFRRAARLVFSCFCVQFLKYFPGGKEVWGAIVIPGLLMGVIFLMPFMAGGNWGIALTLACFARCWRARDC